MLLQHRSKLLLISLLIASFSFGYADSVSAQYEKSIEIRPAILDVPSAPLEVTERAITVSNPNQSAIAVEVYVRSIVPEDEVLNLGLSDIYDAKSWVVPETNYILLEANDSREVNIKVNTPEQAAPSSYALVVFRIVGDNSANADGVKINAEAGTTVIVNTPGEVNELIEIDGTKTGRLSFGGIPKTFNYVQNKGSSHELPIITTDLIDRSGKVISTQTSSTSLLLPNTQRLVEDQNLRGSLFGRYKVRVSVSYGSPRKEVIWQTGTFVVLPSVYMIVLTPILLAIAGKYVYPRKKYFGFLLRRKLKQFKLKRKGKRRK